MKLVAVLVLCLAVSVLADTTPSWKTVGAAYADTFKTEIKTEDLKKDAFEKISVAGKSFAFASTLKGLEKVLLKQKFSSKLIQALKENISAEKSDSFRVAGPMYHGSAKTTQRGAACVYKNRNTDGLIDFVFVTATSSFKLKDSKMPQKEVAELLKKHLYAEMKKKAATLPKKVLGFHSFTKLSLEQFSGLRSAQTQAELDGMLKNEAGQREQVMFELNQKKGDPFLAKLFKNGITHFTSSATVESVEGVDADLLMEYANYLADKLQIPANARPTFLDQLWLASITDRAEWKEIDFIYKLNAGTAKYVSVMSVTDIASNTMDFLVSDIKAGFELGPDVIVSTSTKKSFFGLFSSTKVVITYRPAELTRESIELLFKFFKVSAFDKFRAFRNIK